MRDPGAVRTFLVLSMVAVAPALLAQTEVVSWSTGVSYTYDGSESIAAAGNDRFVYDDVGRLVQAEVNGIKQNYTYDAYGNRTDCAQANPSADCKFTWTINATNNRIGNASYDGSGNVIGLGPHAYSYDSLDMMTGDQSAAFLYTADDERIATYAGGTWRWTIRDTENKVLRELTSLDSGGRFGNSAWTWKRDYVWRDGKLLASRQREGDATTTYHYHLDHLGTPRRITDQKDAVVDWRDYHAFGREVAGKKETAPNTIRYTGQERDDWGDQYTLDYMHARYYNPAAGRFLSVDPVVNVAAASHDPGRWNRYVYALDNPLTITDPTGEEVDLSALDSEQLNLLLHDLSLFTGNEYGVTPGMQLYVISYGVHTGQGPASPTATAFLDSAIGSNTTYRVVPKNRSNVIFAESDSSNNEISFDFMDFKDVQYNGVNSLAFGYGVTLIHELGHLHPQPNGQTLDDGPQAQRDTQVGPLETWVNQIRAERGLPARGPAYTGQRGGLWGWRVLVNFQLPGNRIVYVSAREYH